MTRIVNAGDKELALSRRDFGKGLVVGSLALLTESLPRSAFGALRAENDRPQIEFGVQSGDVTGSQAVIWCKTDRPARMFVEWSTRSDFSNRQAMRGAAALPESDYTAKTILSDLPPGQHIFYRVTFQDLQQPKAKSFPVDGMFRTASVEKSNVSILFSGDTNGNGFGINPAFGGMPIYKTMLDMRPDLFIHLGDTVYADHPILPEIKLPDGRVWKNVTTEGKSKVAETQEEFRAAFRYPLQDSHVQRFNANVAQAHQWDDHEVHNNWYPGQILEDPRYSERNVDLLVARANKAFLEYMPVTPHVDAEQIFRKLSPSPSVEVYMLDERTHRGSNSKNVQQSADESTAFLGRRQLDWLKHSLLRSTATWKIIASDMPIGLVVPDGPVNFEAWANGEHGQPLGREHELAELLRFIKLNGIQNVVWITADVHYAAAHFYSPEKAAFVEFTPFWEFVAGPLHSGTFGPNKLDKTFGPEVRYQSVPEGFVAGASPLDGKQYFGKIDIDKTSEVLTLGLYDLVGVRLYSVDLLPVKK